MLKKVILLFASLVGACLLPAPAFAEAGDVVMSINPSNQELELRPGQTYEGEVGVSNVGRLAFKVHASIKPFYVSGDDYEPDFVSESAYTKIQNWVKLEEAEFSVEPGEEHKLHFTVQVPEDVAGGGQYAAIMLLSDSGETASSGVNVTAQIAALLYGHVNGGEMRTEGNLVSHSLPSTILDARLSSRSSVSDNNGTLNARGGFSIAQTVQNTGNVDFRVTQTMTVKDFFSNREIVNANTTSSDGRVIGSSTSVVLPGTSRTGVLTWTDAPMLGLFQVTQNISFLNQNESFSKVVFLCPVWLMILVIALIAIIVIRIVLKVRRKKKTDVPTTPKSDATPITE